MERSITTSAFPFLVYIIITGNMMKNNSFVSSHSLNAPILFLVFNRPTTTKKVFEEIKRAKPPRLYIAADGPRKYKAGESEKVKQVREHIINNIDWECEVKTLFREQNLGCKYAVSGAIDWFFENEEMGIILEDDCLPNQSFFWFCEELLEKYKDNEQIGMITGTNYMTNCNLRMPGTYFYSNYFAIWGWASWRRAWLNYDVEMKIYSTLNPNQLRYKCPNYLFYLYLKRTFDLIKHGDVDTWDIQWFYHCFMNSRLCITPTQNLISNIGVDGAHASGQATDNHFIDKHEFLDVLQHKPISQMFMPYSEYDMKLFNEKLKPALYRGIALSLASDFLKKVKLNKTIRQLRGIHED
ncbi:hypothetical protein [Methanolobus sp.]|uniref:hypothetical protein n=1 Tax=Methanolobus sp. TaxID=1874737 RepID=UPI0025EADCCA|nr:hypothetical protein [Methanolobus sp.]